MVSSDSLSHYREFGYAVVRGLFSAAEIADLAEAFDRSYAQGLAYGASFRHQNTLFRLGEDPNLGKIVRMVQWPSYFDGTFAAVRTDRRLFDLLAPLLGPDIKQIINQLHWKPPGAAKVEFGYHQDIRFRRPREAYRRTERAYVQTGLAIDAHDRSNGAMTIFPGSHKLGELRLADAEPILDRPLDDADVARAGIDPASKIHLELEPGDLAFWNLYLVHGSGPNRSGGDRRFYLNGYVSAGDCDRGEWAFRGGRPCPLGEPVLVHFEDLYQRPEPHFVDP